MSQARFLASASSRILERSATARQPRYSQRLPFEAGTFSLNYTSGSSSLRCRGGLSKTSYHHVVNPSLLASIRYARTFSSNTPQTSTTNKPTDPPPPSVASKKTKVELRPGPTKSSASAANAKPSSASASQSQAVQLQTPSAAKPHPTKPPPLSASSPKEEALKESEGKGIIDIAKKDMDDAARHGILTPPPADASIVGRLFHQAKELFKFYWAGLKYIFAHRKEVQRIQERVKSGGPPLTWNEHRFILMNRSDMIKLVPFLLTILIIEEIIPLIVMYVPGMLPSTCVLPSQRERIEAKRHERQREAYASAKASVAFKDISVEDVHLKSLSSKEMSLLCNSVGVSSWGPFGMQRYRLAKYLRRIAVEDSLLLAEGKGAKLKQVEIASALCDRGFLAVSYTPAQQRDRLRWWLENVKADGSTSQNSPEDVRAQLLVLMLQEARP